MGRENIYKTLSIASVVPRNTLSDLINFLIESRSYIIPSQKASEAFKLRFSGNSLLSEIVHKLTVLGRDKEFALIKLPSKSIGLREVVDMTFIPFDILQMKDVINTPNKTLSLIPELDDKMIINVTDITKNNGDFSDASQFHYRVVRDFLSRSFYVSTGSAWISPAFVRYIAKVYNMTIGGQIARIFGLSPVVQMFVQTIFCLFFVCKMTSLDYAQGFLKSNHKQLGISSPTDLSQVFAFVEDVLGKDAPESLFEVCQVIDSYNHDQMTGPGGSRLTVPVLNMRFASLFPDGHVSMTALEYPPYFAFLIILVLSNIRIGLSFSMKNLNLIREGQEVMDQFVRSTTALNTIR